MTSGIASNDLDGLAFEGLARLVGPIHEFPEHRDRLGTELRAVRGAPLESVFQAAARIADFARGQGILIGPGRGAVPGSLLAFCLGVTGVDPLRFGLFFERFHAGHPSVPVSDLFVDADRSRMPELRDFVERDLPVYERDIRISILNRLDDLKDIDPDQDRPDLLICPSSSLAGLSRAGIRQFHDLPLEKKEVYKRICRGEGVDTREEEFFPPPETLAEFSPGNFQELCAVLSLCRPEPISLIGEYIGCGRDPKRMAALHPALRPILEETRGLILYQEQIMRIAMDLGGFDAYEADSLRKTLQKRKRDDISILEKRFVKGAWTRGFGRGQATTIFSQIEEAAHHAMCKAHMVGVGMLKVGLARAYPSPKSRFFQA